MAITALPYDSSLPALIRCVICNQDRPPSEVSAGMCDAAGRQAFACNGHFWLGTQFIFGWALFAIQQRTLAQFKPLAESSHGWVLR